MWKLDDLDAHGSPWSVQRVSSLGDVIGAVEFVGSCRARLFAWSTMAASGRGFDRSFADGLGAAVACDSHGNFFSQACIRWG